MLSLLASAVLAPSILIQGGMVVDGSGKAPFRADVRVVGDRIAEIGKLSPKTGERILDANGLVVAPGFIDAHSHADGGIEKRPLAESQISQGITTAVVGQDGAWSEPVAKLLAKLARARPALNFAAFSGHGGIRSKIMGEDYKRVATWNEVSTMRRLVEADMKAGALGLSSGLEYDPGYYADTDELAELARAAKGGLYISHVRDEGDRALGAFAELVRIGEQAEVPAQISHIKLCAAAVWGKAKEAVELIEREKLTADVYPYLFWQSSASALTPSRDWEKRSIWVKAFKDVGGPQNVRLTSYSHNRRWVGKTIAQIAASDKRDPIEIVQEILRKARGPKGSGYESVAVTAMTQRDLDAFVRHPRIMFSSDGAIGGSHPRGAGSFPRILGRFVRERKVVSLAEAIRKMTWLPAKTFHLDRRGLLAPGYVADIAIFDAHTIVDRSTAERPTLTSEGMRHVLVSGALTWSEGKATGARNGRMLRRGT